MFRKKTEWNRIKCIILGSGREIPCTFLEVIRGKTPVMMRMVSGDREEHHVLRKKQLEGRSDLLRLGGDKYWARVINVFRW